MKLPPIAVIGAGSMGANHARVVAESSRAQLGIVIDQDFDRARFLSEQFDCRASEYPADALSCDGAIVATPTGTHASVATPLLEQGLAVLVEKPLADTRADVATIVNAAAKAGAPLTCGFVERFNPALNTACELLDGSVHQIVGIRHSPTTPRATSDVVFDLLIHDLDFALRINEDSEIASLGRSLWQPDPAATVEVADVTMNFCNGSVATLSASRFSQRKIREIRLSTSTQLIEVDLMRHDVTVYRHIKQITKYGDLRDYGAETIVDVPFIRHAGEPLALQFAHFVDLIQGGINRASERASLLRAHEVAFQITDD